MGPGIVAERKHYGAKGRSKRREFARGNHVQTHVASKFSKTCAKNQGVIQETLEPPTYLSINELTE